MIRKLAFCIANYIYKKEKSTHTERYGYYYVLQWLLFQIFEIISTVIVSSFLGCFKELIFVMATVIYVRLTKGGIHADSAKTCMILTTVLLSGCALLSKYISDYINIDCIFILVSVTVSYLFIKIINNKYGGLVFKRINKLIK